MYPSRVLFSHLMITSWKPWPLLGYDTRLGSKVPYLVSSLLKNETRAMSRVVLLVSSLLKNERNPLLIQVFD